jgi:hypothetical protein
MPSQLEAEGPDAVDAYADTVRIRVLPESASSQAGNAAPAPSFDPYSTDVRLLTAQRRPRRTLDDMRRLSETILRNRRHRAG